MLQQSACHRGKQGESCNLRCPAQPDVTLRRRAPVVAGELAKKTGAGSQGFCCSMKQKESSHGVRELTTYFFTLLDLGFKVVTNDSSNAKGVYGRSFMRTPG